MPTLLSGLVLVLAVAASVAAQGLKTATPAKIRRAPVLDGHLDDACWKDAAEYGKFAAHGSEAPAKEQTSFRVLYDDKALYFGITCFESDMEHLVVKATKHDAGVWYDDCVEIFMDVTRAGTEYFHFIFNPLGAKYDEKGLVGGELPRWDGEWRVAVQRHEKSWTAEVALPFCALDINPQVVKTWTFNITRARRAGGTKESYEPSTWVPLKSSFHQPKKFARLGPLNVDFSMFSYTVSAPQKESRLVEGVLDTAFTVKVRNATAARRDVKLEGWLFSPSDRILTKSVPIVLSKDEEKEVRLTGYKVTEQGAHKLWLLVRDPAPRHLVKFPLDITFIPLKIFLDEPFYRNTIYATQNLQQVKLRVQIGLEEKARKELALKVAILDSRAKEMTAERRDGPGPEMQELRLPCAELPTGDYVIRATLGDKQGKVVATTDHPLHKVPPAPGTEVRVDKNLNVLVNGKPFFPFGWIGHVPPERAKRSGHTAVHGAWTTYFKPDKAREEMDKYHKLGIMLLTQPYPSGRFMFHREKLTPEEKQQIAGVVKPAIDHPALLAWSMADEPDEKTPVDVLWEKYDFMRRLDPYHPCFMHNNSLGGVDDYAHCADIIFPDPYPQFLVGGGPVKPITKVSLFADRAMAAGKGRKAVWLMPQAFNYATSDGDPSNRGPTFDEERCMTYLAINHGVRGILYQHWGHNLNEPVMIFTIPLLAREVGHLVPVFLTGQNVEVKAQPAAVLDVGAWRHDGHLYVVAINTTGKSLKDAHIDLKDGKIRKVRILSEERNLAAVNGRLKDRFGPYVTHIYTSDLSETGLRPIRETLARIEEFRRALPKKGNLAYKAKVTCSGAKRPYRIPCVTDGIGDFQSYGWRASESKTSPGWVQVDLGARRTLHKVVVYSRDVTAYQLQHWTGKAWKTLDTAKDNTLDVRTHPFTPVTTDKIRLLVPGRKGRVNEIEVYGP